MSVARPATLPPFQVFFETRRDAVYRFLVSLMGPLDAEDSFQETFLAALRAYPRLPAGTNLDAWVMTIARRKAIDVERARRRAPVPNGEIEANRAGAVPEPADDDLWRAVRRLPPKQRAAVVLRFVNDLSHREIAEVLESSEDAARRSLHEGLKALREVARESP